MKYLVILTKLYCNDVSFSNYFAYTSLLSFLLSGIDITYEGRSMTNALPCQKVVIFHLGLLAVLI